MPSSHDHARYEVQFAMIMWTTASYGTCCRVIHYIMITHTVANPGSYMTISAISAYLLIKLRGEYQPWLKTLSYIVLMTVFATSWFILNLETLVWFIPGSSQSAQSGAAFIVNEVSAVMQFLLSDGIMVSVSHPIVARINIISSHYNDSCSDCIKSGMVIQK
jgi:hypothetical protein